MDRDLWIQLILLLLGLASVLGMSTLPKQLLTKLRHRNKSNLHSKRHFVQGAQILARARSAPNRNSSHALARQAADEADKALSFDPRDAAAHILKALALDLQGHHASALKSIDAALSPPAVKSLSPSERGDSLFKRAELLIAVNKKRRLDSAIEDLLEAVKLSPQNSKAFCLLGKCYEEKEMREEAIGAYRDAKRVDPDSKVAREALDRLAL